ncbi:hypothetical protein RJ640_007882 [Escallonia rubra]|uniref:RING-type E3 ubiquitin transferase n=1 Tax=Escallonia rubra TaxID=112253 RepID=A0AA88UBE2_9ASTE|nr:hypothetical protein RJ640_007882 [Escallonia rubra]
MASQPESSEPSLIQRLISSRNRDLSLFLPVILAFTGDDINSGPPTDDLSDPDPDREAPDPQTRNPDRGSPDPSARQGSRIILINPSTQEMVVIEGRSSSFDSLLRDLLNGAKDGQPPASRASIEAMPFVEVREGEEDAECVVCLEDWEVGERVKEMPCKHKFHDKCIDKWLGIHGSCPVCRYKMPVDEEEDLSSKNGSERASENGGGDGGRRSIWVSFSLNSDRRSGSSDSTSATDHEIEGLD